MLRRAVSNKVYEVSRQARWKALECSSRQEVPQPKTIGEPADESSLAPSKSILEGASLVEAERPEW